MLLNQEESWKKVDGRQMTVANHRSRRGWKRNYKLYYSTVNAEGVSVDAAAATDLFKMHDFFLFKKNTLKVVFAFPLQ